MAARSLHNLLRVTGLRPARRRRSPLVTGGMGGEVWPTEGWRRHQAPGLCSGWSWRAPGLLEKLRREVVGDLNEGLRPRTLPSGAKEATNY